MPVQLKVSEWVAGAACLGATASSGTVRAKVRRNEPGGRSWEHTQVQFHQLTCPRTLSVQSSSSRGQQKIQNPVEEPQAFLYV